MIWLNMAADLPYILQVQVSLVWPYNMLVKECHGRLT